MWDLPPALMWLLGYTDLGAKQGRDTLIQNAKKHTQGQWQCHQQGSHPTWKTLKFVIFFSMPGKCLEFAQKVVTTWNFNLKPGKKLEIFKFHVSSFTFQDVIYKNNSDVLLCHIYIINTNTDLKPNWPWISLLLPGNNLENTWNLVSQEKWEPRICFNTFQDF